MYNVVLPLRKTWYFLLFTLFFSFLGVGSAGAENIHAKRVCLIDKALNKDEVKIPVGAYSALHKAMKMYIARLKSIQIQIAKAKKRADGLKDTSRVISRIKVFKAVTAAFIPFVSKIRRMLSKTDKQLKVTLPRYAQWFERWDKVWSVISLGRLAMALTAEEVCRDSKRLSKIGERALELAIRRYAFELAMIQRVTDRLARVCVASRAPSRKAMDALKSFGRTLDVVERELAKLRKGLGPISKVTGKIQSAIKKKICIPYFLKLKVRISTKCSRHCLLYVPTGGKCRAREPIWNHCVLKWPDGSKKCVKHKRLCVPKFRIKTKPMKACTSVSKILEGGKVGRAVQGALDKAIDALMSPLAKELQKVLPKISIPSLPMKKLASAQQAMSSFQRAMRPYRQGSLNKHNATLQKVRGDLRRGLGSSTSSTPPRRSAPPKTNRPPSRRGGNTNSVASLPKGDYTKSCRNCQIRGGYVCCFCRSPRGGWRQSCLTRRCRRPVSNCGGRLFCRPNCPPTPVTLKGSYTKSCRSCRKVGSRVCCFCRKARGGWKKSCLSQQCRRPVSNCDGRMVCSPRCPSVLSTKFRGSYMRSCRRCRVAGSRICCVCRQRNGRMKRSCLSRRCKKPVSNCNGVLTCRSRCR